MSGSLAYLAGWLLAGLLVAAAALLVLGGGDSGSGTRPAVPTVKEIKLVDAMRSARCRMRARLPRSSPQPRVPRPGVFDAPLDPAMQERALARGIVVIEYRRDLPGWFVRQLEAVQRVIPAGTIVAPAPERRTHALRAVAHRRVLTCADIGRSALDAVQLFRGRFVGRVQSAASALGAG